MIAKAMSLCAVERFVPTKQKWCDGVSIQRVLVVFVVAHVERALSASRTISIHFNHQSCNCNMIFTIIFSIKLAVWNYWNWDQFGCEWEKNANKHKLIWYDWLCGDAHNIHLCDQNKHRWLRYRLIFWVKMRL